MHLCRANLFASTTKTQDDPGGFTLVINIIESMLGSNVFRLAMKIGVHMLLQENTS